MVAAVAEHDGTLRLRIGAPQRVDAARELGLRHPLCVPVGRTYQQGGVRGQHGVTL